MKKTWIVLFAAVTLIAGVAEARGKKPVVEPGKYKEWGEDIDEIEIVKTFHVADYDTIAVVPFDTSSTKAPEMTEEVKTVLAGYSDTLTEALRDELKAKAKVESTKSTPKTAKTLIVRGTVDEIEPGSRAKRYIGGFGAGSAANKVHGEIVDAKSGEVLVRFTQARRSGGSFKFAGGNDVTVMRDSVHAVGKDVAHILDAF